MLRPGGLLLTQKLLENLNINRNDDVVEFAPGLGFTAAIALSKNPKTYTGIERDVASAKRLKKKFPNKNCSFVVANVSNCSLVNNVATKVYGEAMLTMHADHRKAEIIKEAHRILKPNGLYGIHELVLSTNKLSETESAAIKKELAQVSHVNARPLSVLEWESVLETNGFKVISVETSEMLLLEPKRMLADEGFLNLLYIGLNLITHPKAMKRVLLLKTTFKKYRKNLNAVAIIAQKL